MFSPVKYSKNSYTIFFNIVYTFLHLLWLKRLGIPNLLLIYSMLLVLFVIFVTTVKAFFNFFKTQIQFFNWYMTIWVVFYTLFISVFYNTLVTTLQDC